MCRHTVPVPEKPAGTLLEQVGRFRAQAQRTRDHIAGFLQRDNILFGFEQQLERTRIILGFDEILIQMRTALDLVRNVDVGAIKCACLPSGAQIKSS